MQFDVCLLYRVLSIFKQILGVNGRTQDRKTTAKTSPKALKSYFCLPVPALAFWHDIALQEKWPQKTCCGQIPGAVFLLRIFWHFWPCSQKRHRVQSIRLPAKTSKHKVRVEGAVQQKPQTTQLLKK